MNTTGRLLLPYILQSQSQKEVTHNEALNILDALVQPIVESIGLNDPPKVKEIGQCWVIGEAPINEWLGKANYIAQATEGNGWHFIAPFKRLKVWNEAESSYYIYDGENWIPESLVQQHIPGHTQNINPDDTSNYTKKIKNKKNQNIGIEERVESTNLLGEFTDTSLIIPDHSLVIAVNVWVTTEITGASSFDIGVAGDTVRYGNGIGVSVNSTCVGMSLYPTTYYNNTAIRFTSIGGAFTGGVVNTTTQFIKPKGPWNW